MKPLWLRGTNVVAVLPANQEELFIGNLVRELSPHRKKGWIKEIIVVDDGSTDKTAEKAMEAGADKVIRLEVNKGKASAVTAGLRDVEKRFRPEKTIVITLDAEIEKVSRKHLEQMLKPIARGKKPVDMVTGSNNLSRDYNSGQKAIRLSALGGLLRGTKFWKSHLELGYGFDFLLNTVVRNNEVAKTGFKVAKRPPTPRAQNHMLKMEAAARIDYLWKMLKTRQLLSKAREQIKESGLPGAKKREWARAQLSLAKRREKMATGKIVWTARKARVKARHIK